MVNEKVVEDTIKRMLEAGIDDDTIVSTLKDIGLDEESAKSLIEKTKNGGETSSNSNESDSSNSDNEENYDDDDDELNDLKNVKDELETQGHLRELHDATTHNMLNEQNNKIDEISKRVNDFSSSAKSSAVLTSSKNSNMESSSVDELNAKIDALSSLMKQILEVNRKILTELEMKK